MRTFSLLPLSVLCVGFEAALRRGVTVSVEARQQCRLQLKNNQVPPIRTSPIIGTGTATGYPSPPTATSLGSSTSITPFNYGTDPIRGVNL